MSEFLTAIRRYGLYQATRASVLRLLRRLTPFELCHVCMNSGRPHDFEVNDHIPVKGITSAAEFNANRHPDLPEADYDWAFERGDLCVANMDDGVIVGYGFTSNLPTPVVEGVEFFFPFWCQYGFASMTAASYRGQRLAKDRWPTSRRLGIERMGYEGRDVFYINANNSASLKADRSDGQPSIRLGYALWIKLFGRTWCWNSRGARRAQVGFRRITE